jgi:hypothetical protein
MAAVVTLTNISRPGTAYYVGDRLLVAITGGTPDGVVTNTATQNGGGESTTTYGTVNQFGEFFLVVTMSAVEVGNWSEVWKVGGVAVSNVLTFAIKAALPAPAAPAGTEDKVYLIPAEVTWGRDNFDGTEGLSFTITDVTEKTFTGTGFYLGMAKIEVAALPWNRCAGTGYPVRVKTRNYGRNYAY